MSKRLRLIVILALVAVSAVFLVPTVRWYFILPQNLKQVASGSRFQVRDYVRQQSDKVFNDLQSAAAASSDKPVSGDLRFVVSQAKANYKAVGDKIPNVWTASAVLSGFRNKDELYTVLESHYRQQVLDLKDMKNRIILLGLDLSGGMQVVLQPDPKTVRGGLTEDQAVKQAMEILRSRIDRFGVTEPTMRLQDNNRIVIDLPGDNDPERVHAFLMGKGSLYFHIVDDNATQQLIQYQQAHPTWDPKYDKVPAFVPAGDEVSEYVTKDQYGIDQHVRWIVIKTDVQKYGLDGQYITNAQVARDPLTNQPVVNFTLNKEGADKFDRLTRDNVGKSMAVVLDGKVVSYAVIREEIPSGSVQISGLDQQQAQSLSIVLRTASLPVDLTIANQNVVGPTLGAAAIRAGLQASLLGFILVVVFMVMYYKGAGLVADLALLLNMFFMIAILSVFNLTLTLTSIAGLVLTVGMAVDANVIIYERIKDELRLGKSASASVKAGFAKAFWTIMDSNITSLIAAIFLSQLGTGPVQGFAVTLSVGIVSSMFTSLFVSRLVYDFLLDVVKVRGLSISWRMR